MTIEITKNEFDLILAESHPEYKTGEREYVEHGRGADVHYSIPVTRISDGKLLDLVVIYNGDIGGYHDFMHDGDFSIDREKYDIYDRYGKPIEKLREDVKEKSESFRDVYKKMKESGELKSFREVYVISPSKMKDVFDLMKSFISKKIKYQEVSDRFMEIGIKYKIDAQEIFTFSATRVTGNRVRKALSDYKRKYEAFHGQ